MDDEGTMANDAACPACGEVVGPGPGRITSNGAAYHADCWDRSQRGARERLIDGMWQRRQPTCIWCLATAAGVEFRATVHAGADPIFRKVFDRRVGTCPECGNTSVLIHPATGRGDTPRMTA